MGPAWSREQENYSQVGSHERAADRKLMGPVVVPEWKASLLGFWHNMHGGGVREVCSISQPKVSWSCIFL